ncbi:Gfo/Idh/MocA family protein [Streptomyces sp. NPDC048254]|uniref:Gfo/Idh/MocA family protein n=1 Tax=Streptomyces sp. NPDC048254 TaxID=3365525 RepID=UPI00371C77EB
MSDPIRVGIVGVGWGSMVQVPAFRAAGGYEVAALCARRAERVAEAGRRWGIADVSTDWRAFVQRPDLDVISVCTPTDLHHDQVLTALKAGKHVLCEKPVAVHEPEARAMAEAAEAAGVATAVCFESRWTREKLPVWERVSDGMLGDPYFARVAIAADYWHPSHPLQSEWMYRLEHGGGYLLGMAAHDIDFLCCLFGEPEAVCADVRATLPARVRPDGTSFAADADDTVSLLLRMRSGLHATLSLTVMGLHTDSRYRFEAFGSEGALDIEGTLFEGRVRAGGVGDDGLREVAGSDRMPLDGDADAIPQRGRRATPIRALALMLEDWLPALRGGRAPGVPTLRDGWLVQRVIDAARRSSAGEGWVSLN